MALERENVERLMAWLADGSPVRSANAAADALVEKLARRVFGDADWPHQANLAGTYLDDLRTCFIGAGDDESRFAELTAEGADPGVFLTWFAPVVDEWENGPADGGAAAPAAPTPLGAENPHFDGTPGTQFYRFDEPAQEYRYSATAEGTDWATYEQRRYAEPVRDATRGLTYRFDRTYNLYEWYDEATRSWRDQDWADRQRPADLHRADDEELPGGRPDLHAGR